MVWLLEAVFYAAILSSSLALPALNGPSSSSSTSVSTAVPLPSGIASVPEPKYSAPPRQPTCISEIFCPGALLQAVQLASLFPGTFNLVVAILYIWLTLGADSKTFVDKPTRYPTQQVLAAFNELVSGGNLTGNTLAQFVADNFLGEGSLVSRPSAGIPPHPFRLGLDLEPAAISDFTPNPAFLGRVSDQTMKGWLGVVHGMLFVFQKLAFG
jgi:alpha,alpha-trehalase